MIIMINKGQMKQMRNEHLFMDISTIEYRDTNISFSVQDILNNEYYSSSRAQQQKKYTHKQKSKVIKTQCNKIQKEAPATPKNGKKETDKLGRRQGKSAIKPRDAMQEKDTQDNSQTVKIVHCQTAEKQLSSRQLTKQQQDHKPICANLLSKKNQPRGQTRCRTKSNSSMKGLRKVSQVSKEDFVGHAVSSNISLKRNQSLNGRQRSQTFRGNAEQMKEKNQNIVRNDYFEQDKTDRAEIKGLCINVKTRQISASKKTLVGLKKPKKATTQMGQQKFNPKSPRLRKQ